MKCPNCGVSLMGGMVICPKCKFDTRTKDGGESFRLYQNQKLTGKALWEELAEKDKAREENREKNRKEMILTTCPNVEGWRIKKQCGLVFGEIAFKTNFFKSFAAGIENKFDALISNITVSDKELSGTTRILTSAREYALTRMKDEAIDRDANAIVGIQTESSVGGDIIHITISGTAVVIEAV